jgi:hypothetical protein
MGGFCQEHVAIRGYSWRTYETLSRHPSLHNRAERQCHYNAALFNAPSPKLADVMIDIFLETLPATV